MTRIVSLLLLIAFACTFLAPTVYAQPVGGGGNTTVGGGGNTGPSGPTTTLINPLGAGSDLFTFLNSILQVVIRIGTIVVILMLVYCGFKFVTARGKDTQITEAKNNLLWTVVGALILLGAQAIAKGIELTVKALSVG